MSTTDKQDSIWKRLIAYLSGRGPEITTRRSTILLVVLLLLYAYVPIRRESTLFRIEYIFIAIVIAMVFTVSSSRARSLIALAIGIVFIVLVVLAETFSAESYQLIIGFYSILGIFVGYSAFLILYEVTQTKRFDYHLIVAALSAYLLLALLWAIIYTIIEFSSPGSFSVNTELVSVMPKDPSSIFDLVFYYSLITLTTVGYGDITPLSAAARSMATLEPVLGQLLLTVLVAWLVGMYISTSIENRDRKKENRKEQESD